MSGMAGCKQKVWIKNYKRTKDRTKERESREKKEEATEI
jgi:hypothetical protein